MSWNPNIAYNTLPLLPPNIDFETVNILKKCISARTALAKLQQAGRLLPNQDFLINVIPVLEAKDSSDIENIVTTTDNLFRFLDSNELADPMTKEALRYSYALKQGYQSLLTGKPFTCSMATEICSNLKQVNMEIRRQSGTILANPVTNKVIYTPPDDINAIYEKLKNIDNFIHSDDDVDPLIKLAMVHYQFEATHPFIDGNGRTGRILNILLLIAFGLLDTPILYLSRYIVLNKPEYYRLLLGITQNNNWEQWIIFILSAIEKTSEWTLELINNITALIDTTKAEIKVKLPKIYSHELVTVIFEKPYCRVADLVDKGIAKRQTASIYLNQLKDIGILDKMDIGRENLFINHKLLSTIKLATD